MLAAELKKYSEEVCQDSQIPTCPVAPRPVAHGALPPPLAQQQATRPTGQAPTPGACSDALGGMRLGAGGAGGPSTCSQSLPSQSHMALRTAPVKPRVRPSPAPSFNGVPIMELPEPSPMSSSLMDKMGDLVLEQQMGMGAEEETQGGVSMLAPPTATPEQSYNYAASAPASMLWGANAHRALGSAMGGRTPSKTLLSAMSEQQGGTSSGGQG